MTTLHNNNTSSPLSFFNAIFFSQTNNRKNNPFSFLRILFVFLFCIGLQSSVLIAQEVPNGNQPNGAQAVKQVPKVVPQAKPVFVVKKKKFDYPINDIAKTNASSYFPKSFKVNESTLSRKYYNNNIFDIDESDNPFALPIGDNKNKSKVKKKSSKGNKIALTELFTLNDNTNTNIPKWLIFVLLGLLSFMSILLALYQKEIGVIFQSFLSTNTNQNGQREQSFLFKIDGLATYFLFFWGMGTFVFLIPQILSEELHFNTFGALFLSIVGVIGIYFLKHLQLKILSFILPFHQEIEAYSFIVSNTNKTLGFILVPILFLIAYTPVATQDIVLYGSFFFLSLIYIYRTLKGLATAGSIILFHKFHFFVYLCAVEIAPILILLKLLSIL